MTRPTVFIVGAPRSGTTFLQSLLGAHPLIATSQETDLFDEYIRPLDEQWRRQLRTDPDDWQRWRHKGLPAVVTEERFDELVRTFVDGVHESTLALKPGATTVLEKVPGYGRHGELILRYLPHARFIHLVRDGRDVAASIVRAGRSWGREWAPTSIGAAAEMWREHLLGARAIRELTPAYLELRYEQLSPETLATAFAFCGVDAAANDCERWYADASLGGAGASSIVWGGEVTRRLGGPPEEPAGFAGAGGIGSWQRELDRAARTEFDRVAGALLRELRYADDAWIAGGDRKLARLRTLLGAR